MALAKGLNFVHGRPTKLNVSSQSSLPESLEILLSSADTGAGALTTIACNDIIFAAGPWTSQVVQSLGIRPHLPITNLPGHSVLIRPRSSEAICPTAVFASIYGLNDKVSSSQQTTGSPEIFPRPDGTVYIAGENNAKEMPERPGEVEELVDASIAERLIRAAGYVSSALSEGTVEAKQVRAHMFACFFLLMKSPKTYAPLLNLAMLPPHYN
jgi:glycine/D-amino acid oxidase-like deaminating enzyme